MEAVAVPILMKAVDFLFDEARKVLDERRKKRGSDSAETLSTAKVSTSGVSIGHKNSRYICSKDEAVRATIDEEVLHMHQAEIEHLVSLLRIYVRNYHLAREQYARWGSALAPPIVVNNLEEAEESVLRISMNLQKILSEVYGKEIKAIY